MDFSQFCDSLEDPLYIEEEKVKCKSGYKYDEKLKKCVPTANTKQTRTQNVGDKSIPDPLMGWDTWGASGIDGDGYALAVEEEVDHVKQSVPTVDKMSYTEKYDPKHQEQLDKQDVEHKKQDDRMRYGKTGKSSEEKPLRPGEVRKWDKVSKKWVSNKD